jgi:hypothetical protein
MWQYKPSHLIKLNPSKTLAAMLPTCSLQEGGPMPSMAGTRIQTEFKMHNLIKISPPTPPTTGKQKTNFQLLLLWRRAFF